MPPVPDQVEQAATGSEKVKQKPVSPDKVAQAAAGPGQDFEQMSRRRPCLDDKVEKDAKRRSACGVMF